MLHNLKQIDLSKVVLTTVAQEQMLIRHKQSRKRFAAFSLRDKPKEMQTMVNEVLPRVGSKFTRNKLDLYYKSQKEQAIRNQQITMKKKARSRLASDKM